MEQPSDHQWDLVIKVKHGDTLRRIGAFVHGQLMDTNMSKLRAKIISLFKFSQAADLMLTYTDEDGDVVTLGDDHDLHDAVIDQHLNPLRITVQLKPVSHNPNARPEASSPSKSQQPESLPTTDEPLNSVKMLTSVASELFSIAQKVGTPSQIDEVMKSKSFRSAIGNLSKDVQEASALAPLMERFSKLELSKDNQISKLELSYEASSHVNDVQVASHDRIVEGSKLPTNTASSVNPSPEQKESCNMVLGGSDTGPMPLSSIDLNVDAQLSLSNPCDGFLTSTTAALKCLVHEQKVGGSHLDGNILAPDNPAPCNSESLPTCMPALPNSMYGYTDIMRGGSIDKQSPIGTCVPFPFKTGISSHSEVPISKQVGVSPAEIIPSVIPMSGPYQQSNIYNENTQQTYHRGVQCDGCGMNPMAGPRLKSIVKEDYDLGNSCFTKMDNESDYKRTDYALYRTPGQLKDLDNYQSRHQFPLSNALHDFGARPPKTKLDSRFIQDVTVLDGTTMSPSIQFTKIWRMHNNGTVAWPVGTQLVWVGGDKFGKQELTDLEIPPGGFPVDEELDIALNLTTPSSPGRYASYWRMTSPTGQKFGQQIWALIQVDFAADVRSFKPNINLNLPSVSNYGNVSGIIDIKTEPLDNWFTKTYSTGTNAENSPSAPISDLVNEFSSADDASKYSPESSFAPYPLIDLPGNSSMVDAFPVVTAAASDDNVVEETLLKELEVMGFKHNDLNREILRRNEYDLEQSVDDLCDYTEWGPILSTLDEVSTPPAAMITVTKWRRIKRVSWN